MRTGRYTSPHLINWRERTCVNAQPIGADAVVALADPIRRAVDSLAPGARKPDDLEVGTAFCLSVLRPRETEIDLAVVEVGTGADSMDQPAR